MKKQLLNLLLLCFTLASASQPEIEDASCQDTSLKSKCELAFYGTLLSFLPICYINSKSYGTIEDTTIATAVVSSLVYATTCPNTKTSTRNIQRQNVCLALGIGALTAVLKGQDSFVGGATLGVVTALGCTGIHLLRQNTHFPFLKRIPVVGRYFSQTSTTTTIQEAVKF